MSFLAEVEELKKSPMPEVRRTIALKVAEYFNNGVFDGNELQIASDIIRLMAKDAEVRVRKALADTLKNNPELPHDIALYMANDIWDVSDPILEFSPVLTEGDIIMIIRGTEQVAKLRSIARRRDITSAVTSALVYTRNEEVNHDLAHNKTANISEESLKVLIDEFKENADIISSLIDRGDLPVGIAEKLIHHVSGKLKDKLIKDYNITEGAASKVMQVSQEKAALGLLSEDDSDMGTRVGHVENVHVKASKTEQLVRHLKSQGRLSQSLVLRSLCEGNIKFFEASLAVLAGTSLMNARTLLFDKNPSAPITLFKKAGIPESIIPALQVLLKFAIVESGGNNTTKEAFKQQLLEYIVSHNYDKKVALMPYVIAIIGSKLSTEDII